MIPKYRISAETKAGNETNPKKVAGWLVVFDRRQHSPEDLASIEPHESTPARFLTKEAAMARAASLEAWDRKSDWSIFEGSVPAFLSEETESGQKTQVNPEWMAAPFEVRIISDEWLRRPDSFLAIEMA